MSQTANPGYAGWTCVDCGAFINGGTTHYCQTGRTVYPSWTTLPAPPPDPPPNRISDDDVERIAKRVAEIIKHGSFRGTITVKGQIAEGLKAEIRKHLPGDA